MIFTGNRSLLLAASSQIEKNQWFNDLKRFIENRHEEQKHHYTSTIKSNGKTKRFVVISIFLFSFV